MGKLQRILGLGADSGLPAGAAQRNSAAPALPPADAASVAPQPMRTKPAFAAAQRPIFIIGAPRSGTSITTWALGQHPNIQPMPETAWIASMAVAAQLSYDLGSERGRFSHLSNVAYPPEPFFLRMGEAIANIVNDVFEERCTRNHGDWRKLTDIRNAAGHPTPELLLRRRSDDPKSRWIDGTPLNSLYVWALDKLFPEARFIHLVRQPHEVVASLESFDVVGGIPHGLDEAVQNWLDHTHYAFLAQKAYGPARVYTARFEEISASPKSFFKGILEFLGESWSDDCLAPLGKKINSSNVDGRRDAILRLVKDNVLYQQAAALYDESVNWRPESGLDANAKQVLKDRFLEQCQGKRLIG